MRSRGLRSASIRVGCTPSRGVVVAVVVGSLLSAAGNPDIEPPAKYTLGNCCCFFAGICGGPPAVAAAAAANSIAFPAASSYNYKYTVRKRARD